MGYARYIGRIGALAVALGIGAGLAATPWVASAKPSDSGSSNSSSNSSSSSSSSSGSKSSSSSNSSPGNSPSSPAATSSTDTTVTSTSDPTSTADPHTGIVQSSGPVHKQVRVNGDNKTATVAGNRPIRGDSRGTISINTATGALTGEESGVISHLGKQTLSLQGVSTFSGDGTVTGSGTVTMVAANGDKVTGTFVLTGREPILTARVTITGGTGRFANASGTMTVICVSSGSPAQEEQMLVIKSDCIIKGEISY